MVTHVCMETALTHTIRTTVHAIMTFSEQIAILVSFNLELFIIEISSFEFKYCKYDLMPSDKLYYKFKKLNKTISMINYFLNETC